MSKSNPIVQKLLQPDGVDSTEKLVHTQVAQEKIGAEVRAWQGRLSEAGLEDGKYPGNRRVEKVVRDLVLGVKREEVEMVVLRTLLRNKQWSNRIQQIARRELNWKTVK